MGKNLHPINSSLSSSKTEVTLSKVPGLDPNEENRMEAIMNLAEEIKPDLKGKNNLNISIEALDSNSMSSIRQTLFNAIDVVFDLSRALFFNAKKIF